MNAAMKILTSTKVSEKDLAIVVEQSERHLAETYARAADLNALLDACEHELMIRESYGRRAA